MSSKSLSKTNLIKTLIYKNNSVTHHYCGKTLVAASPGPGPHCLLKLATLAHRLYSLHALRGLLALLVVALATSSRTSPCRVISCVSHFLLQQALMLSDMPFLQSTLNSVSICEQATLCALGCLPACFLTILWASYLFTFVAPVFA